MEIGYLSGPRLNFVSISQANPLRKIANSDSSLSFREEQSNILIQSDRRISQNEISRGETDQLSAKLESKNWQTYPEKNLSSLKKQDSLRASDIHENGEDNILENSNLDGKNEQKGHNPDKNIDMKQISKMKSSLFQTVFSESVSGSQKIAYVFLRVILVQTLVFCMTLSKIALQDSIGRYCWVGGLCICSEDFQIKLFWTFFYIFTFWSLILINLGKCAVEIPYKTPTSKFIIQILFYSISGTLVFFYLITVDESKYSALPLFTILTLLSSVFQMKNLFQSGFPVRIWVGEFLKANALIYLNLLHYAFCKKLLIIFNSFILNQFNYDDSHNLIKIYQLFYFTAYLLLLKKLGQIYYEFVVFDKKQEPTGFLIIIKTSLAFVISVPVSSLLSMKFGDWGCWIMLASYSHFLFSIYTRESLFVLILKKIEKNSHHIFKKQMQAIPEKIDKKMMNSENESKILISGCLLDILLMVNIRILTLFISNRWLAHPNEIKFYKDCDFEIDTKNFQVTLLGMLSIFLINIITTGCVVIYSCWTKIIIFEYKPLKDPIMNVYLNFLLNFMVEALIQMFSQV